MEKVLCRLGIIALTAVMCVMAVLGGAGQARAMDSIRYTDLFYGYDSSYLNSRVLQLHHDYIDDILFKIYNDYCDSDEFKWTAIKDGIKAATDLKEFYKLMSDTYGSTDYKFQDAMDKANVQLAAELLNSSADYSMADRVMEGMQILEQACQLFEHMNNISSMTPMDILYYFLDFLRTSNTYGSLEDDMVRAVIAETINPTKMDVILSQVAEPYSAAKTLAVGLMMENIRMEVIDDIIAHAPSDSYLYQGMTRLKSQLRQGFASYFMDNYAEKKVMNEINDYVAGKIGKFVFGNIATCYTAVAKVINIASFVVFDVIFDVPGVDDLTVQKVLEEYATDLYLILTKSKIQQFDKHFDSADIAMYEAVFNAYLSASKAALKASKKIQLSSNKDELQEVMDLWGDLSYDIYIEDIKQTIATEKESQRKLKIMDDWRIDSTTKFHEASDRVEEGCTYLFNGKFRANVHVTGDYTQSDDLLHIVGDVNVDGREITLTIPEGKTLKVDGNFTVDWDNSNSWSSYYAHFVLDGTLQVGGNFVADYYSTYTPGKAAKLHVAGDYAVYYSSQKSNNGTVIFNGTQQQKVSSLRATDVIVNNAEGLLYDSDAHVYGHYTLNGNPLELGNYCTRMYSTTTFDASDFILVKTGGTVTLGTNVKADVKVDGVDHKLIIAEGTDYTIDGNLLINWKETDYSSKYAHLVLDGTLRITGSFETGYYSTYTPSQNAKLYVAGDYAVYYSSQKSNNGTVIFNGSQQQKVSSLRATNVIVNNAEGLLYDSNAEVYGHYALNGNPLELGNYCTRMYSTTTFDDSDFILVKTGGTVTLGTNIKADVKVDGVDHKLIIAEGTDYTIDGNLLINWKETDYSSKYAHLVLDGTLRITGSFETGYYSTYTPSQNAKLYVAGGYAVYYSSQKSNNGTVIFDGTQQQKVSSLRATDVIVNNAEGLLYDSNAEVYGHYALNGNPLALGNYWTYMYSTTTFDDSDFILVKTGGTVTLGTNVKADVKVDGVDHKLIIAEGTDYTIDGNLLINWKETDYSSKNSHLVLDGTLRITGSFETGYYSTYTPSQNAKLYVAGDYAVYYSSQKSNNGTVIFDGTQQQKVSSLRATDVIVNNAEGLLYDSDAHVYGRYTLNGNPLELGNYCTRMYSTTTFDASDFILVKTGGSTVTLGTNVKADVTVEGVDHKLIIAEDTDYTIDGDLLVEWKQSGNSSNRSYLYLNGILRVTGDFTVGYYAEYWPAETAQLYVAGNYSVSYSSQKNNFGTVIFNGDTQQKVGSLRATDVIVNNAEGLLYDSNADVHGHYALNGHPLELGNYCTRMYSTTTFDDSDFILVKTGGSTVTLGTNVKADVMVEGVDYKLIIAEDTDYTIDGNLTVNWKSDNHFTRYSYFELYGSLHVTGDFNMNYYGKFTPAATGTLYVGGDYSVSYNAYQARIFTLVFNGTQQQNATQVECSTLILENTSEDGVHFSTVYISGLFDHKGNAYTLSGSTSFPDYDGDGMLDHEDQRPTVDVGAAQENAISIYQNGTLVGMYGTMDEALSHYEPTYSYLRLETDLIVDTALTCDVYLDLNGHDLTGLMETGGYRVCVMDSATDDFTCDKMGHFNCTGKIGRPVVPELTWHTTQLGTGEPVSYMRIMENRAYSFHRYRLELTHISIKPSTVGLGYKAVFEADPMLQSYMESFGYELWVENGEPVTRQKDGTEFITGKTVSLRVDHFDLDRHGETALYAQVFMVIDGQTLYSTVQMTTMRQAVEAVNANASNYSQQQLDALQTMLAQFDRPMQWITGDIFKKKS